MRRVFLTEIRLLPTTLQLLRFHLAGGACYHSVAGLVKPRRHKRPMRIACIGWRSDHQTTGLGFCSPIGVFCNRSPLARISTFQLVHSTELDSKSQGGSFGFFTNHNFEIYQKSNRIYIVLFTRREKNRHDPPQKRIPDFSGILESYDSGVGSGGIVNSPGGLEKLWPQFVCASL